MAPLMMINPEFQPTKVDRPSDVTGLVDTGQLVGLLSASDATAVLESIYRISRERMNNNVDTGLPVGRRGGRERSREVRLPQGRRRRGSLRQRRSSTRASTR